MHGKSIILQTTIVLTTIFVVLLLLASKLPLHAAVFTFFSLYLIILTGYLLSKLLFHHLSTIFRVVISFLLGFFTIYSLILISAIFRFDCTYIRFTVPVINIAAATALHIRFKKRKVMKRFDAAPQLVMQLKRSHWIIIISLLVFVVLTILISKDPFIYTSDSNDQVSYIRTISKTHEAFPENFYYREGGLLTRDLRKSLYQALWGAIDAITTRREVHEIWPIISAYGSVFFILSLIGAVIILFGRIEIGIIAAILFVLLYHGGLKGYQLITIAYGYPFGKIFYLIFVSSALRYLLDRRREFAILAILSLTVASWTHIAHLIIGFFTFGCFSLLLLSYKNTATTRTSTIKGFITVTVLSTVLNIPYLAMRYIRDYYPNNTIHTHIQGILHFGEKLFVINPIVFFESSGYLGIVSLICIFLFTRAQKRELPLRLLVHTLIAVYVLIFNPLWVPFLAEKLTYLLLRFEFSIPAMVLPAFLIFSLTSRDERRNFAGHRIRYITSWIVVLALIVAPVLSTTKNFAYSPGRLSTRRASGSLTLKDLYDVLNKSIDAGSVIASDPLTSYSIPTFTDQYVICPYDQHATPNDSTALERIARCRFFYDSYTPISKIKGIMREYGAEYLVINGRIPANIQTMFWKPTRIVAVSTIEKLKKNESGFKLIYEASNLALFKSYGGSSRCSMQKVEATLPFIGDSLSTDEINGCLESGIDGVLIKSVVFSKQKVKRGEDVEVAIEWVAIDKQPVSGYIAHLRFDTEFKKGLFFIKLLEKPYRKILERLSGKRYRFRVDIQPLEGIHPPYSWPLSRNVLDKHTIYIPRDVAPGKYSVSVKLDIKTQYPNYSLNDIFSDDDRYSGEKVGEITIK